MIDKQKSLLLLTITSLQRRQLRRLLFFICYRFFVKTCVLVVRMNSFSQAKIAQASIFIVIEKHILRLYIPMNYPASLQIAHSLGELSKDTPFEGFIF